MRSYNSISFSSTFVLVLIDCQRESYLEDCVIHFLMCVGFEMFSTETNSMIICLSREENPLIDYVSNNNESVFTHVLANLFISFWYICLRGINTPTTERENAHTFFFSTPSTKSRERERERERTNIHLYCNVNASPRNETMFCSLIFQFSFSSFSSLFEFYMETKKNITSIKTRKKTVKETVVRMK